MRRVHTEILIQAADDLTLENVVGTISTEQDQDNIRQVNGPVEIVLPAGAVNTQFVFPTGSTYLRFLAITGVTVETGVQVKLAGSTEEPVLVKPPTGTDMDGELYITTSVPAATGVYFTNPSATTAVSFKIMAGFAIS